MKRVACFLLVALMLVAGSASAGEKDYAAMLEQQKAEGLLHLWDIPFGITMDEFLTLAKVKTGFAFESVTWGKSAAPNYYVMKNEDNSQSAPRVDGYIVSWVEAEFSDVTENNESAFLESINIVWPINHNAENEYAVSMFRDLIEKLENKFGKYETAGLLVADPRNSEEMWTACTFNNEDGSVRWEEAVTSLNNGDRAGMSFTWNTVLMNFVKMIEESGAVSHWEVRLYVSTEKVNKNSELYENPKPYADILEERKGKNVAF